MNNSTCSIIETCIVCDSRELVEILNMNKQPLANSFKNSQNDSENVYPLKLNKCSRCHHLQLSHMVHPDQIFKNYLYVSGTSNTQLEYFDWFSKMVKDKIKKSNGNILDIGCNDGSQLDSFKKLGFFTFGVDPAENLHINSSKKHKVVCDYFNKSSVNFSQKFDAIICQNAFSHNYDQKQFLEKCKSILSDDGFIFITISQSNMIQNNEFDVIYHEHYSYYSVTCMKILCERMGLHLVDLIQHPIHGNSYIFIISPKLSDSSVIDKLIQEEEKVGLYGIEIYKNFEIASKQTVLDFSNAVKKLKDDGNVIIGYGSPAKGNTMLNFCGVTLDFIVDDNPLKQGKFTPGTSIPIVSMDHLETIKNKEKVCFVPLAWNFFEEISKKISSTRPNIKTTYIKYFPVFEIFNKGGTVL